MLTDILEQVVSDCMDLDLRKRKILSAVIEHFVATGEATSSKQLQSETDLNVSSATIRNELMYLVETGYLEQKHTSAGRIPTQKGYRYYVDYLMVKDRLDDRIRDYIDRTIESGASTPEGVLSKACEALSRITGMAAIITTPPANESRVYKVKFVATSRHTAMAILITTNGAVKSKIFRCDFVITPELLALFDQSINRNLAGVKLTDIDNVYIQTVASKMGEITLYMPQVLFAVYDAVRQAMISSVIISGQTNLLFIDGYDFLSARNVLRFLSDTEEIAEFLNRCNGTKVFIGNETGKSELDDSSIIISRYEIAGERAGAIALIGPERLRYRTLVSCVEYVSLCVSNTISELLDLQRR